MPNEIHLLEDAADRGNGDDSATDNQLLFSILPVSRTTLRCPKGHETNGGLVNGLLATISIVVELSSGERIDTGQRCLACLANFVMEKIPLMEPVE